MPGRWIRIHLPLRFHLVSQTSFHLKLKINLNITKVDHFQYICSSSFQFIPHFDEKSFRKSKCIKPGMRIRIHSHIKYRLHFRMFYHLKLIINVLIIKITYSQYTDDFSFFNLSLILTRNDAQQIKMYNSRDVDPVFFCNYTFYQQVFHLKR